ncbi:MAG: GGDEF domain-containing protein [Treponema sp.]|nr:GGDEF domain-containing protein [Treponema sp.]
MNRNIAVIINSLSSDYSNEFLSGFYDYFKDTDANLIITQVQIPRTKFGLFEYQYWSGMKILESEDIDTIIVMTPLFTPSMPVEELVKYLEPYENKTVISVSVPLSLPNVISTQVSCKAAYNTFIKEIKDSLPQKRIAYVSAGLTDSNESKERLESFKEALENNGLTFYPELVLPSDFTASKTTLKISEKYPTKESIDFDALFAANDDMAIGAMVYLNKLGVLIPGEVKVVGYDDIFNAQTTTPSLSTINQQIFEHAQKIAELAYKRIQSKITEKDLIIDAKPIFRESTGKYTDSLVFTPERQKEIINHQMEINYKNYVIKNDIYYLLDSIQSQSTLEESFKAFVSNPRDKIFSGLAICLYNEPVKFEQNTSFNIPSKVQLAFWIDYEKQTHEMPKNVYFNPKKHILPDKTFKGSFGNYMLQPVFFEHNQFGYIIAKCASDDFMLNIIHLKIYSSLISQAYLYTNSLKQNRILKNKNSNLDRTANYDMLTGVYNRRGFMEFGQAAINSAIQDGKKGVVLFGDMNSLKVINDTYGHEEGDKAIKEQAAVLRATFRSQKTIGRLGGDEFAIVIPGLELSKVDFIKQKILKITEDRKQKAQYDFDLSISIGAVEFDEHNSDLSELLKKADSYQYEEKRRFHLERS